MLQHGFNQRVMRITGISPNMAVFGSNMNDLTDLGRMNGKIDEFSKDKDIDKRDYELLRSIRDNVKEMNEISQNNWQEVTKLSVKSYNDKNKITAELVARNNQNYKVGNRILYFIGDKQVARGKWREKWTGPWIIEKKINDSSIIITDPTSENQKRVSIALETKNFHVFHLTRRRKPGFFIDFHRFFNHVNLNQTHAPLPDSIAITRTNV